MTWYLLLLVGRCSTSSSSGLAEVLLPSVRPAVALPLFLAGESRVGLSTAAAVVGVGVADRIGAAGAGVEVAGPSVSRWSLGDCQSKMSFSSSDEK
ncbi:hypothetical protein GQ457_14G015460 [Hibiscus cannabinus]